MPDIYAEFIKEYNQIYDKLKEICIMNGKCPRTKTAVDCTILELAEERKIEYKYWEVVDIIQGMDRTAADFHALGINMDEIQQELLTAKIMLKDL